MNVVLALLGYSDLPNQELKRSWYRAAVDGLEMGRHPNVKVGIVWIQGKGTIALELTNDESEVRRKIQVPFINDYAPTGLSFSSGFEKAGQLLSGASSGERKVIIYVGVLQMSAAPQFYPDWLRGARIAKSAADPFIVGCPMSPGDTCRDYSDPPRLVASGKPGLLL